MSPIEGTASKLLVALGLGDVCACVRDVHTDPSWGFGQAPYEAHP